MSAPRRLVVLSGLATGGALTAAYLGLVTGAAPLDLGVGRRNRPLGPQQLSISAPRETVFDIIATPYGERAPRALREKAWSRSHCGASSTRRSARQRRGTARQTARAGDRPLEGGSDRLKGPRRSRKAPSDASVGRLPYRAGPAAVPPRRRTPCRRSGAHRGGETSPKRGRDRPRCRQWRSA